MASNCFGHVFRITTWGESHGPAIGVVIDGCPAGLTLSLEEIQKEMERRAPGRRAHTSPRREPDQIRIESGLFEGKTTGAPLSIIIKNSDARPADYEPIRNVYRPGHAHYTYEKKYGAFDYRGGGRSSARETAARVAAGAVAKQLLQKYGISVSCCLVQVGNEMINYLPEKEEQYNNSLFCPNQESEKRFEKALSEASETDDSLGGIVQFHVWGAPTGLGDPIYNKLEAQLAYAMMSIPASKGFEIGKGFSSVEMFGSEHNDSLESEISFSKNDSGGILGGISTGQLIWGKVAFKPTSSIRKEQQTINTQGEKTTLQLSRKTRHDPCVAIRAVPVVEAMCRIVLMDALLMDRHVKL